MAVLRWLAMRCLAWVGVLIVGGVGIAVHAQALPPPSILKEDCSVLKGKSKRQCEARNAAGDASASSAKAPDAGDTPTGADADVPGEPPSPRPAAKGKAAAKPDTSDMPTGKDADPPSDSMQPLLPDGRPDPRGPLPGSSSSSSAPAPSSSSSSSSSDDDDVAPTTSGSDTPVKAAALKDLGSHADSSAARVKLEQSRVTDDVKVGRFYLQDGNFAGAEARFKDALEHDPENPDANFALAELLLKQKRKPEAAAQLKRYLSVAPDDEHTKDAQKMLAKLGR